MKILSTIIAFILAALPAVAQQTGVDAISSSADGVSTYMPVVRMLCFSIAGVIAIVGAYTTYYAFHQGQDVQKRVMMTVGSAMTFLTMAIFLPKFFGYDDNGFDTTGLIAQNGGGGGDSGTGTSSMAGDTPGVPGSGIDATIPDPADPESNYYQELSPKQVLENTGLMNSSLGYYSIDYRDVMNKEGDYYNDDSFRMMDDAWNYIVNSGYDFNEAYNRAAADLNRCVYAAANGDSWPWSPSDYRGICYAIQDLGNALWNSLPGDYRKDYRSPQYNFYYDMFNP